MPVIQAKMSIDYRLDNGTIMGDRPAGPAATERGIYVASRHATA